MRRTADRRWPAGRAEEERPRGRRWAGRRHHDDFGPGEEHGHEPGPHGGRGRRGEGGPRGRGRGGPFGPEGPGGPRGRFGRGRAQRGDVRIATLLLLAEQPMHGYQIMQAMADRTGGAWRPSPGAVYPTIALLEDEGLVTTTAGGGRKLVTLTEAGRAHVQQRRETWGDPFAELTGHESGPDLRGPLHELHAAARQVAVRGDRSQAEAAAKVLADARRALYLILAEVPDGTGG
jgi:DNA-binding PadR family transcriptional regulator